jgi:hypothetical protein
LLPSGLILLTKTSADGTPAAPDSAFWSGSLVGKSPDSVVPAT